jgi:hypothetical protein
MSTSSADFNAQVIEEFHATGSKPGGMFETMPLLLLHHTGARSGKRYVNPLAYMTDEYATKTERTIPVIVLTPTGDN